MKTLADFKRALTVGRVLQYIYHETTFYKGETGKIAYKQTSYEPEKRTVKTVSSSQVSFTKENGTVTWLQFPKASECLIEGNKVTILEPCDRIEGKPMLPIITYIFSE